MVKCALINKSKFIRYIHQEQPLKTFSIIEFHRPEYLTTLQMIATDHLDDNLNIDRLQFALNRTYINEHEEEVAVYYEI